MCGDSDNGFVSAQSFGNAKEPPLYSTTVTDRAVKRKMYFPTDYVLNDPERLVEPGAEAVLFAVFAGKILTE